MHLLNYLFGVFAAAVVAEQVQWGRIQGSAARDFGNSVTVDSDGNIYSTGFFSGVSMDGLPNVGYYADIYLTKHHRNGTKAWTRVSGSGGDDLGAAVALDRNRNIYVVGTSQGSFDGEPAIWGNDIFLIKYNYAGTKLWTRIIGTVNHDYGYGVVPDNVGDGVYITGYLQGSLDGEPYVGGSDILVAKINSDGSRAWTRLSGTWGNDFGYGVSIDSAGAIYVTGFVSGSIDGEYHSGGKDIILMKYYGNGTKAWSRLSGTSGNDCGYGVGVDNANNIYVSGYTSGSLDGQEYKGDHDVFLMKYDNEGKKLWTRLTGTSQSDISGGLSVGVAGSIFLTGYTKGSLNGQEVTANSGNYNLFVQKYSSDGGLVWTQLPSTSVSDYSVWHGNGGIFGCGVSADSSGYVYATGTTSIAFGDQTNLGESDIILVAFYDGVHNSQSTEPTEAPTEAVTEVPTGKKLYKMRQCTAS